MNMWNSVKKYYCHGDYEERIYDEPNTADTWWAVDVSSSGFLDSSFITDIFLKSELPEKDEFPHCYLPLHFWLDKGLVTRRVSKYPMVLRPAWLPRRIRNASGNEGGVLVGYMPMVSFTYRICSLLILKSNVSCRLLIPQILQAAHLLRLKNLPISRETFIRRF